MVKWSPSMCAKLILASSAAFFASAGLTNICGTIYLYIFVCVKFANN